MLPAAALSAHRFLLRASLTGVHIFAWIFVVQFNLGLTDDLGIAVSRTLFLYALAQVVTILLTPYAARSLSQGTRRLSFYAVLFLATAFALLAATLSHQVAWLDSVGGVLFALFMGAYRALYWVPYRVEEHVYRPKASTVPEELFLASVPALVGIILMSTASGVAVLCAGAIIALMSLLLLKVIVSNDVVLKSLIV